ncbi:MAG: hypothetical protein RLZZ299_2453 [Pseudomonadota bacterium]
MRAWFGRAAVGFGLLAGCGGLDDAAPGPGLVSDAPDSAAGASDTAGSAVDARLPDPEAVLFRFGAKVPPDARQAVRDALGLPTGEAIAEDTERVVIGAAAVDAMVSALRASPGVLWAEPDRAMPMAEVPLNDPLASDQWHLAAVGAPAAWSWSVGAPSALVAVCDTGVSLGHPDLVGAVRTDLCYNAVRRTPGDCGPVHWHGTAVAGMAAAAGNNGYGGAGVAWRAGIVPVRVSNHVAGWAYTSDLAHCVRYAADVGAAVANVSYALYAGGTLANVFLDAADYADTRGTVVVAASGNESVRAVDRQDPQTVLFVGATKRGDAPASFTNVGPYVDLAAPGANVLLPSVDVACAGADAGGWVSPGGCGVRSDRHDTVGGTSFAAPAVAGAIALLKALNPAATPAMLRNAVVFTAADRGAAGEDEVYGSGVLDVAAAVRSLLPSLSEPPPTPAPDPAVALPTYTALTPARILDTRSGRGGPVGRLGALDGGGVPFELQVAGRGGVPLAGASAVSLGVTVTDTETDASGGFVTVYPCGARPDASSLNFEGGRTVPNAVLATLSPSGTVCLHVRGRADVLVDVHGWFAADAGYTPQAPVRLLDTRSGLGGVSGPVGAMDGAGGSVPVQVAGAAGVPTSGVAAAALNVTVTDTSAPDYGGFVTVFPCGAVPEASSLNFVGGQTVANAVVAPLSPDGTVCVHVHGRAQVLVDLVGWFAVGGDFVALAPTRVLDTRNGLGGAAGPVGSEDGSAAARPVRVTGLAGIPATGVAAVSMNVTAIGRGSPAGYVTAYACDARPDTSNLNFSGTEVRPGAVLAPVSAQGDVCLYVYGVADLIVDVNGWFRQR